MRAFFGTSMEGGLSVSLSQKGEVVSTVDGLSTGDVLALFETALRKAKVVKKTVDEIIVDRGPGGFSIVRRRVAAATGLARGLGAALAAAGDLSPQEAAAFPSSAFALGAPLQPLYAAEPHITIGKKTKTWNAR